MFEIKCVIPEAIADPLEDFLCEFVRSGWSILNKKKGDAFFLMGYFEDKAEGLEQYVELRISFPDLPENPGVIEMADTEWQDAYKAYIQPWSSRGLHWVPVWLREEYSVPAGDTAIYLDAGMAFGTGSHETTRLMAMRLLDYREAGEAGHLKTTRVIDAGCGSGILAMSAAKLGYHNIFGFDRDTEAIRVSEENRAFNDLPEGAVAFLEGGLEEGLKDRQGDLILANIQADVLNIYAEVILQAVAPGGTLALSGILAIEVDAVKAHFEQLAPGIIGEYATDTRQDGEWCDLCFFRK